MKESPRSELRKFGTVHGKATTVHFVSAASVDVCVNASAYNHLQLLSTPIVRACCDVRCEAASEARFWQLSEFEARWESPSGSPKVRHL